MATPAVQPVIPRSKDNMLTNTGKYDYIISALHMLCRAPKIRAAVLSKAHEKSCRCKALDDASLIAEAKTPTSKNFCGTLLIERTLGSVCANGPLSNVDLTANFNVLIDLISSLNPGIHSVTSGGDVVEFVEGLCQVFGEYEHACINSTSVVRSPTATVPNYMLYSAMAPCVTSTSACSTCSSFTRTRHAFNLVEVGKYLDGTIQTPGSLPFNCLDKEPDPAGYMRNSYFYINQDSTPIQSKPRTIVELLTFAKFLEQGKCVPSCTPASTSVISRTWVDKLPDEFPILLGVKTLQPQPGPTPVPKPSIPAGRLDLEEHVDFESIPLFVKTPINGFFTPGEPEITKYSLVSVIDYNSSNFKTYLKETDGTWSSYDTAGTATDIKFADFSQKCNPYALLYVRDSHPGVSLGPLSMTMPSLHSAQWTLSEEQDILKTAAAKELAATTAAKALADAAATAADVRRKEEEEEEERVEALKKKEDAERSNASSNKPDDTSSFEMPPPKVLAGVALSVAVSIAIAIASS